MRHGRGALKHKPLSREDYLNLEAASSVKHEFVDGQVYALAGATDRHNRIVTNLTGHLWLATRKGPCRVYSSDMKLRVATELSERFYYPDVMVTCDESDTHDLYKVAPCLLAEVISPSTAATDRREKLLAYQSIPELRDYLIVSADERLIERYRRDPEEGWWYHELRGEAGIKLPYLNLILSLDDLYEGVL